ncbi:GH92 family glycosyl hydrolase [Pseudarthrobacter sp. W1I19]|uniref:GH92 family glycosyl hydrolase n=1 Tax=Pseudarthrobacter sp. W1I19 TaxID=3042288 RepID=UPI0027D8FA97|nr:GH92 family glycosyl hydrolase [Pseudarthrobacter sp. W1I19]
MLRVPLPISVGEGATIAASSELRYDVFPLLDSEREDIRDAYLATAVAIDLVFSDGTTLSSLDAVDQHSVAVAPVDQYESKTLQAAQWNRKRVSLDAAVGKQLERAEIVVATRPSSDGISDFEGFVGKVAIEPTPAMPTEPIDWVRTTRGSHSSFTYSRGNTVPLVAVPHGGVFGTPMTDARTTGWTYTYAAHNGSDGRPALQALSTSHIPSPWIQDRGVFQIMPSRGDEPVFDAGKRALGFDHRSEIDRPHRYAVELDGGLQAEITAGKWSVFVRLTFPGSTGWFVVDQVDENGHLELPTPSGSPVMTGFVDGSDESPRMFVRATIDRPVLEVRRDGNSKVRGAVRVSLDETRSVTIAIGTSFLSTAQAGRNLAFDLDNAGVDDSRREGTFDAIAAFAACQWNERLAIVEVDGATADQRTTVASSLYRLFLYPNTASENVGSHVLSHYRYASPFHAPESPHTPFETGLRVVDGPLTVNNGFWDTYRTVWPALDLLRPDDAGELLEGFVQHYRDGGWTSRWTAPGPIDNMTGTTSDVIFADAITAGVPGLHALDAYDSALHNATVVSPDPRVGRKGVRSQTFRGYTDTRVPEGMSWTIDSAINDFGISQLAVHLLKALPPGHPRLEGLAADAEYYSARAARYAIVFDQRIGFFQGRNDDGTWRVPATRDYDPAQWGHDYTETNGWGTAFTAPHDGAGLATLHGGPAALEKQLDLFFATPETGRENVRGSYDITIHEMAEARDVRMGMLGLSNQPAHHIPFMYAFTGAHHKTQAIVSEALRRLFLGSEIGQGYPGDEDNGEMSAWYLFAALGLYPLVPVSGRFVLTTPLFPEARVQLPLGDILTIRREGNPNDDYIAEVTIDGERWQQIEIPRERLLEGPTIVVTTSSEPTAWASHTTPTAHTAPGACPRMRLDTTSPVLAAGGAATTTATSGVAANVFDDTGDSTLILEAGDSICYTFIQSTPVNLYTVTSAVGTEASWRLEGSEAASGDNWQRLDEQINAEFMWPGQTRPFLATPAKTAVAGVRRIRLVATTPLHLIQIETLADK